VKSVDVDRIDFATLAPLVAVIVALALYPQFILHRSDRAVTAKVAAARQVEGPVASRQSPGS
jgi:NADH:ubiquinone oxidoreductase subunit 4 (subunit M)